jgi:hypothetical protein
MENETAVSCHGEVFRVGDEVAVRPDCDAPRDFGKVVAIGEYGRWHVEVEWKGGYCGDQAHIDRIALVRRPT